MQVVVTLLHLDESITHQRQESRCEGIRSLPDGGNHGLLIFVIPLHSDGEQTRRKGSLEETKEETNSPDTVYVLRETKGEDTLQVLLA
jgi:hypothetical protein